MKEFYTNKKDTREVLKKTSKDGTVDLYFNFVYNHTELGHVSRSSDCTGRKTYSARSKKLIDRKIKEWVEG